MTSCEKDAEHWKPLMSEDLADFEKLNGSAAYSFDGKVLTGITTFNSPNTFLASKQAYGDFELRFEVLLTEGLNSGVQIRSTSDSSIMEGRVHGYQVEIEDSPRGWAGGIYDEARRGWIYPLERNVPARKAFRKGEWNAYHIMAKGDTLKTWVNGLPCAHLVDTLTSEGLIGFQVHSIGDTAQAGLSIRWRNIAIKTEAVGEGMEDWPQAPMATILPALTNNTEEFIKQPGFYIHQLAGEPQVQSPVAASFDERGNIWVVELPGYMRDIDGADEERPDGKIVLLSDINQDGIMDRREVYKNNLVVPRALCLAYNGLLYNNGRALYFDDFKTGNTELVDSFYVQGGNIEHQPNGLYYNLDNWIYSAKSNARYRRHNGHWEKEATSLRGQWGINADEHGRLVYNDNSNGLVGDRVMPNQLIDNPYLRPKENLFQQLCTDNRVYPYQATAVNRGYMDNVLDENGKLKTLTSSCSPIIYKGTDELFRNAFTCAPEVNLIKRYQLEGNSPFAQAYVLAHDQQEFLLSKEETFRPVNLYNHANDGMLLVDLRKGVIQHRAYMTNYLREKILDRKLDAVVGKGRMYFISTSAQPPKNLAPWDKNESLENKLQLLSHANGAMRLAMQKYLVAHDLPKAIVPLKSILKNEKGWAQIHALWTLLAKEEMEPADWQQVLKTPNRALVYHALSAYDQMDAAAQEAMLPKAYAFKDANIDLLLCKLMPHDQRYRSMLDELIKRYQNSPQHAEALLARKGEMLPYPVAQQSVLLEKVQATLSNVKQDRKVSPALITYQYSDNRNEGFPAYTKFCGSCHGADGMGQANLAPPILYSEYVEGTSDKLAALILQGLQGPVHVNGELYDMNLVMPGLKDNDAVDDETVAAIIAFVNNAFSKSGQGIGKEKVGEVRAKLRGREQLLTEQEVMAWE